MKTSKHLLESSRRKTYGGTYGCKQGLIRVQLVKQEVAALDLDNPDLQQLKDAEMVCHEEFLSCMVLWRADQSRYVKMQDNLSNNMIKGVDNFPKMIIEMMRPMMDYKIPTQAPHI